MQFHEKEIWYVWFHEFFCLDFFKFSGPLWCALAHPWWYFLAPVEDDDIRKKNTTLHQSSLPYHLHNFCTTWGLFSLLLMTWQTSFFEQLKWFKDVNNTTRLLNGWVNWCTKMLVSTITSWKEPPTPNAYSALNIFRKIYVKMISRKHHEMQWQISCLRAVDWMKKS